MAEDFKRKLAWGQTGETSIAYWLRKQGYSILPAYDVPLDTGKGPRLYSALASGHDKLVAPDILAILPGEKIQWVEAKRKTRFTWRWTQDVWQTGIDKRHYHDYLHVRKTTGLPLWIMFLHEGSMPSKEDKKNGCPPTCPTGLFAGEICNLEKIVDHEDSYEAKNGREYPMVYWNYEDLLRPTKGKPLATLEEVLACQPDLSIEAESQEEEVILPSGLTSSPAYQGLIKVLERAGKHEEVVKWQKNLARSIAAFRKKRS